MSRPSSCKLGLYALATTVALNATSNAPSNAVMAQTRAVQADVTAYNLAIERAKSMMRQLQRISAIPGIGFSIGYKEAVLFTQEYGYSDFSTGMPVTNKTQFRYSDATSVFTAAAIMQLVEKGKINLDEDIRTYVPYFPQKRYRITVRQLLNHTSGIGHFTQLDLDRGMRHTSTIKDSIKRFRTRPLKFRPGTAYLYSSYGYSLLGAAIEDATGKTYNEYMVEEVFKPIETFDLIFENKNEIPATVTKHYTRNGKKSLKAPIRDLSYVLPAAGINGSAESLVKLAAGLWSSKILSTSNYSKMLVPATLENGRYAGTKDNDIGLGWKLASNDFDTLVAYHGGYTVGAGSGIMTIPSTGIHLAYVSNARWQSFPKNTLTAVSIGLQEAIKGHNMPSPCMIGSFKHKGKYNGQRARGSATFSKAGKECIGTITMPIGFDQWVEGQAGPIHRKLPFVRIAEIKGKFHYGLITPVGIHIMTIVAEGDSIKASVAFNAKNRWEFDITRNKAIE